MAKAGGLTRQQQPCPRADDEERDEVVAKAGQRLAQAFPATKIMFLPDAAAARSDLLAASSDALRLWRLAPGEAKFDRLLEHPAVRLSAFAFPAVI